MNGYTELFTPSQNLSFFEIFLTKTALNSHLHWFVGTIKLFEKVA
jgi:hypothetical protein